MSKHIKIWSFLDQDRSAKVRWTANELDYEIEEVRVRPGDHTTDHYRQINPYEQIPAVELDGKKLIESTAICLSLAERHPEAGLIPEGKDERDLFWQSMSLTTSALEMPLVLYWLSKSHVLDSAWAGMWAGYLDQRLKVFGAGLPREDFICGAFSLADICAAYVLNVGIQAELLRMEGRLETYLRRLMARPAARAARFFDSLKA